MDYRMNGTNFSLQISIRETSIHIHIENVTTFAVSIMVDDKILGD